MESAPFECKICGRVVKYDRNTVHTHLKNVHGITWAIYLDRIRKERRGETLDDLPALETHECKVCNVSVKYFLRPFSLVPLAVESTQLTLCHSLIWQINPWVLVDSKSHQPLLNVNSFILKC